jgi:hypothetical protein
MTDRRGGSAVAVTVAAVVSAALIGYALLRTPAAVPSAASSAVVTLAALTACAVLAWWGPLSTRDTGRLARRVGGTVGLVLGGLLAVENVAEVLSPVVSALNIPLGYAVLAVMALAYAVSGAVAGTRAAWWTALVGFLVWYPTLWLSYLASYGSVAYDRALRAEGEYDDFHRSGMPDFTAFLLRDFLGAGFYHLLLGVVLALGIGSGAAGTVTLTRRALRHRAAARTPYRRMLAGTLPCAGPGQVDGRPVRTLQSSRPTPGGIQ